MIKQFRERPVACHIGSSHCAVASENLGRRTSPPSRMRMSPAAHSSMNVAPPRSSKHRVRRPRSKKPPGVNIIRKTDALNIVAVDLGGDSCRVSLARWKHGTCDLRTVHRFGNTPTARNGHLYWNLDDIRKGVLEGLALCARESDGKISSIAVDGWAVDYVRLDRDLTPLADPFCYRDPRTESSQALTWSKISSARIYAITGVQHLRINTLYQLCADQIAGLPRGLVLNIPEYVLHTLGGRAVSEFTNATHTQLVDARTRSWSDEILECVGIDRCYLPEIVPPGSVLGTIHSTVASDPQLVGAKLIAPSCHDTGSAVAGIPAEGKNWAFISSGTWSIVGTVLPEPCITQTALRENFSNEGGLEGQIRFLKNVNGMWILQECLRHWRDQGTTWEIDILIRESQKLAPPKDILPVCDSDLLLPGNMPRRINHVLAKHSISPLPEDPRGAPQFANLLFHSLAVRYAEVLGILSALTNKSFERVYVVGGGSRNSYLNKLIAERSGLDVVRGPVESSTLGNVAVQLAVLEGSVCVRTGVSASAVQAWSQKLFRCLPCI
jgi:rhamnulokinase